MNRFIWLPWGDGSSMKGFGNICDDENEVVIAQDVPEDYGEIICVFLNDSVKATKL